MREAKWTVKAGPYRRVSIPSSNPPGRPNRSRSVGPGLNRSAGSPKSAPTRVAGHSEGIRERFDTVRVVADAKRDQVDVLGWSVDDAQRAETRATDDDKLNVAGRRRA